MVEVAPRIAVDETVRFGRSVIAGTRVPVDTVVGKTASGMSFDEVAEEYGIEPEAGMFWGGVAFAAAASCGPYFSRPGRVEVLEGRSPQSRCRSASQSIA
jgi:hypothetical protein